jgi:hypothetical protein
MDNHYEEFTCRYCGYHDYRYVRSIVYDVYRYDYIPDICQYEPQYKQTEIVTKQCKLCFSNERGT